MSPNKILRSKVGLVVQNESKRLSYLYEEVFLLLLLIKISKELKRNHFSTFHNKEPMWIP